VRHVLFVAATVLAVLAGVAAITGIAGITTLAPAPRSLGMDKPAAPRALVPACAVAPSRVVCQAPARPTAVAVATVTAAAQHDLDAAACAQKQPACRVHTHLGKPKVLDGRVQSGPHCCGTTFIGTV